MKGENRTMSLRAPSRYPEKDKTLITNLPLLFANGKPVSIENITLHELEEFIPFMVRCSMGRGVSGQKDLNSCTVPDWWPKEEFSFRFPLRGPSIRQKLNALRSLVCRCYTYYDCEFLLKFSSQLSLTPPSSLQYVRNDDSETTCIYDKSGTLLVKFRNENLMYDAGKHPRKHLFPIIQSPSVAVENKTVCIDLTVLSDDYSEDDKEGHHFTQDAPYCLKRTRDSSDDEIGNVHGNKKTSRGLDGSRSLEAKEQEPDVLSQDGFVSLFGLQRTGQTPEEPHYKFENSKTRLIKRFMIVPFSCNRGGKLLASSRVNVNVQQHMDRIERYTSTDCSTQVCTRTTGIPNLDVMDEDNPGMEDNGDCINRTWVHAYRWPSKCHNPKRLHRGPSLKDCKVTLHRLSKEFIRSWTQHCFKDAATMTPEEWQDNSVICDCSLIPVISLIDDQDGCKTSDKSCSTRCNCKTGNDIRSTHHTPHNLKNVASNFRNINISNNNNANRNKNDSHAKKHFSSTNQKSNLGRTRSNGPILAEFPSFSYTTCASLDNSLPTIDKITPCIPLRLNRDLSKVKRIIKTRYQKPQFASDIKTIDTSKHSFVPRNISVANRNNSSNCILFIKNRNSNLTLRKKNATGQWETGNSRDLKTDSDKSLNFNVELLQENLIPNNKILVARKKRGATLHLKGVKK